MMPRSDQCIICAHFRFSGGCDAFPDGIPEAILTSEHDHTEPYPGDNGVRFEVLELPEEALG
jgi:hypothetical protein